MGGRKGGSTEPPEPPLDLPLNFLVILLTCFFAICNFERYFTKKQERYYRIFQIAVLTGALWIKTHSIC